MSYGTTQSAMTYHENIPTQIFEQSQQASRHVAEVIATEIRRKEKEGESLVLGLATGSTPTGVYDELIRLH